MPTTSRPNLLFVFADQLRPQSCGYMGDTRAQTPCLDRLATESVNFFNTTSMHPVCGPYRASLFTGCYSSTNGYVINDLCVRTDLPSLAGSLNAAGYDSAYFGKWHLHTSEARPYEAKGHHQNMANQFVPPGPLRLGFDHHWAAYNFNHTYHQGFYFRDTPERIPIDGYEPDGMTNLALRYLESRRDAARPFNLFLSYGPPHQGWNRKNVPPKWLARFDATRFEMPANYADGEMRYNHLWKDEAWWLKKVRPNLTEWMRVYYAMTANLDWNVGRLLAKLDELGLRDNTLVVFTSDHGEMFGAHGCMGKLIYYDESALVPMLLRWPDVIPAGLRHDACLNTPDILPTLFGLMGVEIPATVEGMNLAHCARGEPGPEPEAAFLQGMGASVEWDDGFEWRAARDKRYTYAIRRVGSTECLFDNAADPLQMKNLINDPAHADARNRLRAFVRGKMAELKDEFQPLTWYRDHWTDEKGRVRRGAKG